MTQKEFLDHLIYKDVGAGEPNKYTEYEVKFHDDEETIKVWARNFTYAGVLAMAWKMHKDVVGFGIDWIKSGRTGNKVPFDIKS